MLCHDFDFKGYIIGKTLETEYHQDSEGIFTRQKFENLSWQTEVVPCELCYNSFQTCWRTIGGNNITCKLFQQLFPLGKLTLDE